MTKNNILFFAVALIEGATVMCVELCCGKMLSPYFGTSIQIWAAVLGLTLIALMSGYYIGGAISAKNKHPKVICWLMLIAGCYVMLIPIIGEIIFPFTIQLNLTVGAVVSLISLMLIPLILFGAVSPLIIEQLSKETENAGKNSGYVYAVSTLGGIIATFITGFYFMPVIGIAASLYVFGLAVIFVSLISFYITKSFKLISLFFVSIAVAGLTFKDVENPGILYESDGILGNIKVVERYFSDGKIYRELMVNNITQTIMDVENPDQSLWNYVDVLAYNIHSYSNGDKMLLLGLGGGTLYKRLKKSDNKIDVIEIDERIEKIAKQYFFIEDELNVIIDDARHYINTATKKYDVVIYDLFLSETPPGHLMTSEAFAEIKNILNPTGILVINFYGFTTGKKGRAARSLYLTLLNQEFDVEMVATDGEEHQRNLLFICGKKPLIASQPIIHKTINKAELNLIDAELLVDDKPVIEHLYLEAALQWRQDYNEANAKQFLSFK